MTGTDLQADIRRVREEMSSRPDGLIRHAERVATEARSLARRWGVDPERAELAAWGHDLFRAHEPEELLRLARESGVPVNEVEELAPVFLHGPIAAVVMRERLAIRDEEVIAAIRDHTIGAGQAPMLARVLLLADKFESNKRAKVAVLRRIRRAADHDIDMALLSWADANWMRSLDREWTVHPGHWEARQAWVAAHHAEIIAGLPDAAIVAR